MVVFYFHKNKTKKKIRFLLRMGSLNFLLSLEALLLQLSIYPSSGEMLTLASLSM